MREVLKEEVIQEKASPPKLNKSPRERKKSEGQDFKVRDKVESSVDLFEVNDASDHNENIWEEPVKKMKGGRPRKSSIDDAEDKVKTVKARKPGRGRKLPKKPVSQKQVTKEEFSDEEMEETSKPQVSTTYVHFFCLLSHVYDCESTHPHLCLGACSDGGYCNTSNEKFNSNLRQLIV